MRYFKPAFTWCSFTYWYSPFIISSVSIHNSFAIHVSHYFHLYSIIGLNFKYVVQFLHEYNMLVIHCLNGAVFISDNIKMDYSKKAYGVLKNRIT